MQIPPNMKRRTVAAPAFSFTELSLSDDELVAMCVIPSRVRAATVKLEVAERRVPKKIAAQRRQASQLRLAVAGLGILALPSCTNFTPVTAFEAGYDAVELVRAVAFHKSIMVAADEAAPAAAAAAATHEDSEVPSRRARLVKSVPPVVDSALLVRADRLMSAGQYRAALAMYRKLIARKPRQVDALFGAALASHELSQNKGSAAYLQKTLALKPDHPLANILAGFGDQLDQRYNDARVRYSRFLSVEDEGDQAEEIRAVLASMPAASAAVANR